MSLLFNSSLNAVDGVSKTDLSSLSMAEDSASLNHSNAQKLSLKNAWTRVLSNHEGLHAQEYAIKRASKMKLAAKLSFLPQIDLSAFYVYLSNPIKMDFASQKQPGVQKATNQIHQGLQNIQQNIPPQVLTPQIQAGIQGVMQGFGALSSTLESPLLFSKQNVVIGALSIIYPLYMGGARFTMVRIADLMQKDANEVYRLKKLSTFQELVSVYYGMVLNTEVAETLEEVEKGHYKHFQNALKMQKVGQIARVETLGAQVAYDKAHIASVKAKDVLEVSQLSFNSILSSKDDLEPSSKLEIHTEKNLPDLSFFVASTLNSYPALKTLENQIQISKENTKLQIAKFLPQVSFLALTS